MKVTFVYGGFESLGVESLSACLKQAGHKTNLIYSPKLFNDTMSEISIIAKLFEHKNYIIKKVIGDKPDIVAFSAVTDDFLWCIDIAKKIKKLKPSIIILFGGIHITSVPDIVIKHKFIDILCIGEGEQAIVELCNKLKQKKDIYQIQNLWVRDFKNNKLIHKNPLRPLIYDLDVLPFSDKDLFYKKAPYNEEHYTIMATRGCTLNCPFCHHNVERKAYKGHKYGMRTRSPENIIKELTIARKKYKFKYILFEDDLFLHDKEWIRKFTKLYIKSKINTPWFCVAHVHNIDDDVAEWLNLSGCKYIEIGIQTLSSQSRESLNRPEETKHILSALKCLKKHTIAFNCDHIAGIFGETEQSMLNAAKYYNEIRPNRIYLLFLTLYPNTDIAQEALKKGYATLKDVKDKIYGRGGTTTTNGSVHDPMFDYYRFLFGYLPILPKNFVDFLIKTKLFKKLPKWIFIASVIPETLSALFSKKYDFRGPVIIKKYFYHIIRGGF
ncbi:MAG: B12-binding domain-containing radical SAM protein [Candidatus Muirbacterium halophilum]|nr:B12-binding domain-containing radical SAM protein [Candidatus Muirbacterium halophilum]